MIELKWEELKYLINNKASFSLQHVSLDKYYKVFLIDGSFQAFSTLIKTPSGETKSADEVDFENNYMPLSNKSLEQRDSSGSVVFGTDKPSGDFSTVVTHNFCNNTTWVNGTTDSTWEMIPANGKILTVDKAEVQFQHDVSISPTELYLEYHAWVAPATTMAVQTITFKNMLDIFELGNDHYHAPSLPEVTGGLSTVVFNYASKLRFYGSEKLGSLYKLVIKTKNNDQITGSYATVGLVTEEIDQ